MSDQTPAHKPQRVMRSVVAELALALAESQPSDSDEIIIKAPTFAQMPKLALKDERPWTPPSVRVKHRRRKGGQR